MSVVATWKNETFAVPLCGPIKFHPVTKTELSEVTTECLCVYPPGIQLGGLCGCFENDVSPESWLVELPGFTQNPSGCGNSSDQCAAYDGLSYGVSRGATPQGSCGFWRGDYFDAPTCNSTVLAHNVFLEVRSSPIEGRCRMYVYIGWAHTTNVYTIFSDDLPTPIDYSSQIELPELTTTGQWPCIPDGPATVTAAS